MGLFGDVLGFISGDKDRKAQEKANDQNAALQREFAQKSVQWKVADAKSAGIHPLAALGAQTYNASPSYVGASAGDSIRSLGQGIDRAVDHFTNREQRAQSKALQALALERAQLENDLLRTQISTVARPTSPPLPSAATEPLVAGQGDAYPGARVDPQPARPTTPSPGRPSQEAGAITDFGFVRTPTGLKIVPSADMKQRMEDDMIAELQWHGRNSLKPVLWPFGMNKRAPDPRDYPLPRGYKRWVWNPASNEYVPSKN